MNPLAIIWKGVVGTYDNLFPLVGMNLLWLVLSVPLVIVVTGLLLVFRVPSTVAFPIAMLFAILGPNPASVGILNYANQLANEKVVDFSLFWTGLRELWWRSTVLALVGVLGAAILGVNIYFYLNSPAQLLHLFAILWLYAMILWTMMLLYVGPLLVEQQNKSFRLILKNSFLLCLDNLPTTAIVLIVLVVLSIASILITLLVALVTGALVAMVETNAVFTYLEKYRARAAKTAS
jgi:uncharacterized membrane protein YesL